MRVGAFRLLLACFAQQLLQHDALQHRDRQALPGRAVVAGQLSQKASVVADARPDHTVDIVLGKGYTKLNPKVLPSVAVPGNQTVCVPAPKGTQPIPSGQNPH